MYNWQHDGHQKSTFNPTQVHECPLKCGQTEEHNHYLECKDKTMVVIRETKLRTLKQHLIIRNTHPCIVNAIAQYVTEGPEATLRTLQDTTDQVSGYVKRAVEENMHLSQFSLEKGFISSNWIKAQEVWAYSSTPTKRYKQQNWGRDLVMGLQQYTYEIWKARNSVVHGSNIMETREIKLRKSKERVTELYSMSRTPLTLEDKKIFRLPLQYRLKMTKCTSAMDRAGRMYLSTSHNE